MIAWLKKKFKGWQREGVKESEGIPQIFRPHPSPLPRRGSSEAQR